MSAQQIADEGHWPMMPELAAALDKKLSIVDSDRLRLWANGVYVAGGDAEWAKQKPRVDELTAEATSLRDAVSELRAALEQLLSEWPECGCCPQTPDASATTCGACLARAALDRHPAP